MKAIVFAAGLGTRLKPFTLTHPKALVEVGGKPMLQRVIERLIAAGITEIVVNVHHFAAQIIDFLNANNGFGASISISDESERLLDTGGGIAKAAPLLAGPEPFVAYNADIFSDFPLRELIEAHKRSGADVTLLTSHRETSRLLYFDACQRLCGWQNLKTGETRPEGFTPSPAMTPLAFGGVHVISPKVLPLLERQYAATPVFSLTPFYLANCRTLDIRAMQPAGPFSWYDVGRPETLELARKYCFINT